MLREFKVEANIGAPQVSYRETIRSSSKGEGKYARQTGGKGQYGHVVIEMEPAEVGKGLNLLTKSWVELCQKNILDQLHME